MEIFPARAVALLCLAVYQVIFFPALSNTAYRRSMEITQSRRLSPCVSWQSSTRQCRPKHPSITRQARVGLQDNI